jgi:hypothetical protein
MSSIFMATSDREREALVAVPRQLIGRRLRDVHYLELASGTDRPSWVANHFHSLDYGAELVVDGPVETWSVIWKLAGDVEALLLYAGPLVGHELLADGDYARWDVASEPPWVTAVGQRITDAEFMEWEDFGAVQAPGALRLAFEHSEAVLALGSAGLDGEFAPSADDVAVFASVEDARAHGAIRGG